LSIGFFGDNVCRPARPKLIEVAMFGIARIVAPAALVASAVILGGMAPEPDPVPRRWQLDVTLGPVRQASFEIEGQGPRVFVYMTYKVSNNSGQDLLFAPSFELVMGNGQAVRSGRGVPADITKKLIEKCQNNFLQDQIAVIGNLMQGPENAKEGLVAWPLEDFSPTKIAIYAAGFSGETTTITPPGSTEKTLLRKTLSVNYVVKGELSKRGDQPLEVEEQRWVMR